MPKGAFMPKIGDSYAVFNIMLPDDYVCNDTLKIGASWEMFKEAAKFLYENETPRFTFKGELDGLWAKSDWVNINGRLRLGGFVNFSDEQFLQNPLPIRIVAVKDFVNKPHSPQIELSNCISGGSVYSELGKIEENEVATDKLHKEAIQFTKRRYRDLKETTKMIEGALLNFSDSINPITVSTMQVLLGDESLQFRFVNNKTNPVNARHDIVFSDQTQQLTADAGVLQHLTLGIKSLSSSHAASEYLFWTLPQFVSAVLDEPAKSYYLYAKVSKTAQTGTFLLSEDAIPMNGATEYYLLCGALNSEFEGSRSFVQLYGYTEMLPGRMTIDKIVSPDGQSYFDLANRAFRVGDNRTSFEYNVNGDGVLRQRGSVVVSPAGVESPLPCWRGDWDSSALYYAGDEVGYVGASYRCKVNCPTAGIMPINPNYWEAVAKGSKGDYLVQGYKWAEGKPARPVGSSPEGWSAGSDRGVALIDGSLANNSASSSANDSTEAEAETSHLLTDEAGALLLDPYPANYHLWGSAATFDAETGEVVGEWSDPYQMTGQDGKDASSARNLIPRSGVEHTLTGISVTIYTPTITTAVKGEVYTVAVDYITHNNTGLKVLFPNTASSSAVTLPPAPTRTTKHVSITSATDSTRARLRIYQPAALSTDTTTIYSVMLVKGEVAPSLWVAAPEDVQGEIDAAAAAATAAQVISEAINGNFTEIKGGLVLGSMMSVREGTRVTAGISGKVKDSQGKYLPALWGGGTYEQAIAKSARFIVTHNGDVKIGQCEIEPDGSLKIASPNGSGQDILLISNAEVKDIATGNDSGALNNLKFDASGVSSISAVVKTIGGRLSVRKDSSDLTVTATLSCSSNGRVGNILNPSVTGSASAQLYLCSGSSRTSLGSVATMGERSFSDTVSINATMRVTNTAYWLELEYAGGVWSESGSGMGSWSVALSASTMSWSYIETNSTSNVKVGRNGISVSRTAAQQFTSLVNPSTGLCSNTMAGTNKLLGSTTITGTTTITGALDAPGFLCRMKYLANGSIVDRYGSKSVNRNAGKMGVGRYKIYHSISNQLYTPSPIAIVPLNGRNVYLSCLIEKGYDSALGYYYTIIGFSDSTNGNWVDVDFEVAFNGQN